MPWTVHDARRYFYRSVRVDGRVKKEYVGRGQQAEFLAVEIKRQIAERKQQTERRRSKEAAYSRAVAPISKFCECADLLAKATLIFNGFHQHDRGAWRRRVASCPKQTR